MGLEPDRVEEIDEDGVELELEPATAELPSQRGDWHYVIRVRGRSGGSGTVPTLQTYR